MSRPEIIKLLKKNNPKLNQSEIESIIDIFTECIRKALSEQRNVEIRGFGSFCIRDRKSIRARNPKSGESIELPKRSIPYFRASKLLKHRVN